MCSNCLAQINLRQEQSCPDCEKFIVPKGGLCRNCQASKATIYLDNLIAACSYEEPLKKIIYKFKYNFVQELSLSLSHILYQAFLKNNLPLPDLIVPVPLHPLRKRWRGFNQAEALAQELSILLAPGIGIELFLDLKRIRWTNSQMKIKNYQKRKTNLEKAFTVEKGNKIKNKTILLIDDIATSGATLSECARILKKNGAQKVVALILARQTIK